MSQLDELLDDIDEFTDLPMAGSASLRAELPPAELSYGLSGADERLLTTQRPAWSAKIQRPR